jgi:hypothetical protein
MSMNILSRLTHGYLDYLTVVIFLLAPSLLGLSGLPAMIAYGLAFIHLALTLATDFPSSMFKIIPFKLHGWLERVVGPLLIVLPFVLGFSSDTVARNFYIGIGIVIIAVGILTNYKGTDKETATPS